MATVQWGRGPGVEAIEARQEEILGGAQRIAPLSNHEIDPAVWDQVDSLRNALKLDSSRELPSYSRTMLKHPALFRCRTEMATLFFRGTLPPRARELAILRIAWLLGAPYEWGEHVEIAARAGVAKDEIERVIEGSQAFGWDAHEAAVLRAVEEMLSNQSLTDDVWLALAGHWNEAQLIEFVTMVGHYAATAMVQNVLRIELEPGNRGLAHR